MMTAEQFYHKWMDENWGCRSDVPKFKDWFNICEAYAADQLAELRKASAIAKKYEQKLLRELGRVMTALHCTDEFDGPDEAVRTANELVQALGEADKLRAELGFADTAPLNVWLADLRAQLAEKEREIADLQTQCRDIAVALGNQIARAEAAEQRLQEAKAQLETLTQSNAMLQQAFAERTQQLKEYRDACGDLSPTDLEKLLDKQFEGMGLNQLTDLLEDIPTIADLRERLRQREAELEHAVMCMNRSCKRCNAAFPSSPKEGAAKPKKKDIHLDLDEYQ